MSIEEKVSLTISINKEYRDRLRTMAAEQNLQDPDLLTSASTIAREIICEHLDNINSNRNTAKAIGSEIGSPLKAKRIGSSDETVENRIE